MYRGNSIILSNSSLGGGLYIKITKFTYNTFSVRDVSRTIAIAVYIPSSVFRPMYRSMCWHVQLHAHASPVPYSCKETSHSASDSLIDVLTCLD